MKRAEILTLVIGGVVAAGLIGVPKMLIALDNAASRRSYAEMESAAPQQPEITPERKRFLDPAQSVDPDPARLVAPSRTKQISGSEWFGAMDKVYYQKLIDYAVDKDSEAFRMALARGLLTGECTRFRAGEKVFVTDTSFLGGLVRVRREGETAEYWTNREALR